MFIASTVFLLLVIVWVSAIVAMFLCARALFDISKDVYVFYLKARLGRSVNLCEKYGSWAIISGATNGIGEGYAKALGKRGLKIVLLGRNEKKLAAVDKELKSLYPGIMTKQIIHDFSGRDSVTDLQKLKSALKDVLGNVGILVNNVGVYGATSDAFAEKFQNLKPHPFTHTQEVININISSMILLTSITLPGMINRKKGIIINISSLLAVHPLGGDAMYSPTKSYQDSFSRALRVDLKETGVEVQGVYPGFVDTTLLPKSFKQNLFFPIKISDRDSFCEKAVESIGSQIETYGDIRHHVEGLLFCAMVRVTPLWLKEYILACTISHRRVLCDNLT